MNIQSGILLHLGIVYVMAPQPDINKRQFLAFQNALMNEGIDYGEAKFTGQEIFLRRNSPPLQIRVAAINQPLGQLLVISPKPQDSLEIFGRNTEAIIEAFVKTWPQSTQIIKSECSIHYLFESSYQHAFEEIWTGRLKQPKEDLGIFGAPVAGGGLRFVMPPIPNNPNPVEIEVKIESFLKNPRQLYIDVQFKWPQSRQQPLTFDPVQRLKMVDEFIESKVIAFLQNEQS